MVIEFEGAPTSRLGFFEGLAAVRQGSRWGYIDKTGEFVIPPRFPDSVGLHAAHPFREGLAAVSLGGNRHGFINRQGEIVMEVGGDSLAARFPDDLLNNRCFRPVGFCNGLALVEGLHEYRYIDTEGKTVFKFRRAPYLRAE